MGRWIVGACDGCGGRWVSGYEGVRLCSWVGGLLCAFAGVRKVGWVGRWVGRWVRYCT